MFIEQIYKNLIVEPNNYLKKVTQNLYPLHKKIQHQYLNRIPVYLTDKTPNSDKYFIISDMPSEFSAGKNSFKIFGNSDSLKIGTKIFIEILDSNGNTVYYEVSDYVDRSKRRVVSIYIYPETSTGIGTITILGVASKDLLNGGVYDIPKDWRDRLNLKWSKDIFIDPLKRNKSEIIFNNLPTIRVNDVFGTFNEINYKNNLNFYETLTPTASLNYKYLTDIQQAKNYSEFKKSTTSDLRGQKNAGENIQLGINLDAAGIENRTSRKSSEIRAPGGFEYDIIDGAILTLTQSADFSFEDNMVGGKFVISNPTNLKPKTELSGAYEPVILEVLNDTQVKVNNPYEVSSSKFDRKTIKSFNSASFDLTYKTKPEYSSSQAYRTFSFIRVGNLNPISGEVYRVKTFVKSNASVTDYELIGNTIVSSKNLFVNTGSNSMNESYGSFSEQNVIDSNWKLESHVNSYVDSPDLIQNDTYLMNSVGIVDLSFPTEVYPQDGYWKMYPSSSVRQPYFFEGNHYQLKFDIHGIKPDTKIPKVEFYMSGSSFIEPVSTKGFGKYVGEVVLGSSYKTYRNIKMNFISDRNGFGVPILKIIHGKWYISNLQILPLDEPGFSPNHFNMMLPINSVWDNNLLDFKFEFYDYADNLASQYVEVQNVSFASGSPSYIQGGYNLITGSQYIGNRIGSGIQMSGVDSAFIMNPDYDGFISASEGKGSQGFMIWSGSVHPDWIDNYAGVGIELIANSESYFRYRTNPSELDIRTDKFYFGGPSQYISGSNGVISIQSDNIVLSGSGVGIYTEEFYLGGPNQYLSGSSGLIEISSSKFQLSSSGEISANSARLENYAYADFIGSRVIVIDETNYDDFIKTYYEPLFGPTKGYHYLDLSQESSGSACFIRFETSSNYPITHIVAPNITGVADSDVGATITTEFSSSVEVKFFDLGENKDVNSTLTFVNGINNLSGSFSFKGYSYRHRSLDDNYSYTGSLRSKENARYVWTKGNNGWALSSTTNYDRTNVSFLRANMSFQYGTRRNIWIPAANMSFSNETGSRVTNRYDTTYMMPAVDIYLGPHGDIGGGYPKYGYDGFYGSFIVPDYIENTEFTMLVYYSYQSAVSQSVPPTECDVLQTIWKHEVRTTNYIIEDDYSNIGVPKQSEEVIHTTTGGGTPLTINSGDYELGKIYTSIFKPNTGSFQSGKPVGFKFMIDYLLIDGSGSGWQDYGDGVLRIFGVRIITDKKTNEGGFNTNDINEQQQEQGQID